MEELEEIRNKLGILGFTVVDAVWGEINGFGAVPAVYCKGDDEQELKLSTLIEQFYEAYPEENPVYHLKVRDTHFAHYAGFVLFAGPLNHFDEDTEAGLPAVAMHTEELHHYRKQFLNLAKYLRTQLDS